MHFVWPCHRSGIDIAVATFYKKPYALHCLRSSSEKRITSFASATQKQDNTALVIRITHAQKTSDLWPFMDTTL